jgi:DNA-binding transcriptional LysR family regulator
MDETKLRYFALAARCLNFSEVARMNYVSQPTVSHQIGLLEHELGVKLFERLGKMLVLSREGEIFYPIANRILAEMQDVPMELAQHKGGGKLSICVTETCVASFQKCLTEFMLTEPGILVDITHAFSDAQMDNIQSAKYDVFFLAEKMIKNNRNFQYRVTHIDNLCLVFPKRVPVPDSIRDFGFLDGVPFIEPHILNSQMLLNDIRNIFMRRDYTPNVFFRYNRMEDALLPVSLGVGFAILPQTIVQACSPENVNCIPFPDDEFHASCVVAWRRQTHNNAVGTFVNVINRVYSE